MTLLLAIVILALLSLGGLGRTGICYQAHARPARIRATRRPTTRNCSAKEEQHGSQCLDVEVGRALRECAVMPHSCDGSSQNG